MPKLLSQRVYSALLVLDVSAPSEPVGDATGVGRDRFEDVREKENRENERGERSGGGERKKRERSGSCVISKRSRIKKKKRETAAMTSRIALLKNFCNTVGPLGRNTA